jgi:amidohydrolase
VVCGQSIGAVSAPSSPLGQSQELTRSRRKCYESAINLVLDARAMQGDLVDLRRRIHREPEIGLRLPIAQRLVLDALDGLPLELSTGSGLSSVVAVLRGGRRTGRTVLLRADMDALPVTEQTGLEFAAPTQVMHACGHDLHSSMLVGAARLLCGRRDALAGDVVFMFQPGEEGHGGARMMIEEGVLKSAGRRPDAAFALHVVSAMLPLGTVGTRPGPLMAAVDVLRVTVHGAGGHGSMPHRANDPIPATAEMVTALQTMVTRRFDVFDPVVITVGSLHAGTQHNVIPDRAYFEATVRSFSPQAHARVSEQAVRVCQGIARAHGLELDGDFEVLFPVTVNDAAAARFVGDTVAKLFGANRFSDLQSPVTGSEDFSLVLDSVPGAMAFLGACPPNVDPATAPFNHSPLAIFDEGALCEGAALYAGLALDWLAAVGREGHT